VRYLCHVMRLARSSRDTVHRRKNSCLRDVSKWICVRAAILTVLTEVLYGRTESANEHGCSSNCCRLQDDLILCVERVVKCYKINSTPIDVVALNQKLSEFSACNCNWPCLLISCHSVSVIHSFIHFIKFHCIHSTIHPCIHSVIHNLFTTT